MSEKEQTEHLALELDLLINRYRKEYEMTYAAVVGVLFIKAHLLCDEAGQATQPDVV